MEPVIVGFCGTDHELMLMGRRGQLGPKFPAGTDRLINGHEGVVWVQSLNRFAIVLIRGVDSIDPTRYAEDKSYFEYGCDQTDGRLQTSALQELAREYPSLRIAIGHFGMVTRKDWEQQILLARLPNVYIESGGITWLFNEKYYPYPSAVRSILTARDLCGMNKLMWGSDYPRTMTAITYRMSWDFIEKIPPSDRRGEKAVFP